MLSAKKHGVRIFHIELILFFIESRYLEENFYENKTFGINFDIRYNNLQNGLMLAIHSWTESRVDIKNLKIMGDGTYSCTLEFTFSDNFGLDEEDMDKFGAIPGFRSWYILQHYDGFGERYKPFETVVTIDYNINGVLSEEKR